MPMLAPLLRPQLSVVTCAFKSIALLAYALAATGLAASVTMRENGTAPAWMSRMVRRGPPMRAVPAGTSGRSTSPDAAGGAIWPDIAFPCSIHTAVARGGKGTETPQP